MADIASSTDDASKDETHDTYYLKYLQQSYGTTSVPFFGIIICIVILLITTIILMFNMVINMFKSNGSATSPTLDNLLYKTIKMPPLIYYE